jgi:hypothetical protein
MNIFNFNINKRNFLNSLKNVKRLHGLIHIYVH